MIYKWNYFIDQSSGLEKVDFELTEKGRIELTVDISWINPNWPPTRRKKLASLQSLVN